MTAHAPSAPQVKIIPPLVFLAGLIAGWLVSLALPTDVAPYWLAWTLGGILIIMGAALVFPAAALFRRRGTTVRPDRPVSMLVTSGPYRFTRNPMYLGLATIYLGIAIGLQSLWALVLLPVVLVIIGRAAIAKEEAYMAQRFGDDYQRYTARVRRWL